MPHSNYKQTKRAKETKLQTPQPLPTTPYIVVGQVRVLMVLVAINVHFSSLPFKLKPQKLNYNHQAPKEFLGLGPE